MAAFVFGRALARIVPRYAANTNSDNRLAWSSQRATSDQGPSLTQLEEQEAPLAVTYFSTNLVQYLLVPFADVSSK